MRRSCPSRVESPTPSSGTAAGKIPIDAWPNLNGEVLLSSRSRKVCMTCHWFSHHASVNRITLLTCERHQGVISHGKHLTQRCQDWTDDMVRQLGWVPEVA